MSAIPPRIRSLLFPFALVLTVSAALFAPLCADPPPSPPRPHFADAHEKPLKDWTGPVFRLSQDYPSEAPPAQEPPWHCIDFTRAPEAYMNKVLQVAYLDNIVDDEWHPERNPKSKWYHVPWLDWGNKGREFIHGLTRERRSRPCELSENQHDPLQTWAVSVYNESGGYVIGKVWANPSAPNPAAATFPEGTVAVKLLFTRATEKEVPFLAGSPQWDAYIDEDPVKKPGVRQIQKLRLLQVDFAVRDKNADRWTGWVFGTFQYNANANASGPKWNHVTPVALTWGNDPGILPEDVEKDRVKIVESWINPDAQSSVTEWTGRKVWGGRGEPMDRSTTRFRHVFPAIRRHSIRFTRRLFRARRLSLATDSDGSATSSRDRRSAQRLSP